MNKLNPLSHSKVFAAVLLNQILFDSLSIKHCFLHSYLLMEFPKILENRMTTLETKVLFHSLTVNMAAFKM